MPPPSIPYHQHPHRRPHSATTTPRYDLSTKQYRIPQPQTYNRLKQNINKTFNLKKSAAYQDILELTNKSLTNNKSLSNSLSTYHNKIQQLCTKYCIKPLTSQQKKHKSNHSHTNLSQSSSSYINNTNPIPPPPLPDTDKIAMQFIKRKSKQKQSLQRQRYLHQQINQQSSKVRVSSKKIKTEEFFKFTCENIRKLQTRDKENRISQLLRSSNKEKNDDQRDNGILNISNKNNHTKNRRRQLTSTKSSNTSTTSSRYNNNNTNNNNNQIIFFDKKKQTKTRKNSPLQQQPHFHPYLKIYQQSQKQALQLILNNNTLNLNYFQQQQLPVQVNQAQEWEKYQKSVKEIYSGIKRMRYAHSAREMVKNGRVRVRSGMQRERYEQNVDDHDGEFYIT